MISPNNPGFVSDFKTAGNINFGVTFTVPGVGTKLGVSWGVNEYEKNSADGVGADDFEAESWMIGVYHPLTKSLNLVAEYVDADYENIGLDRTLDGDAKTISLGAILFF